jgi:hypothetical protein
MSTRKLNVPAFRDESAPSDYASSECQDGTNQYTSVLVVRWGRVAGFTFRAGDRLVLGSAESGEGLLLLRPRGYGWPMLGRRQGGQLVAEPGGVRAAPQRWRVAAAVVGVERSLSRSVTDRGTWWVVVQGRGTTSAADLERAGMVGGCLSHREVDALCHRAARFMEQGGGSIAVGVAPTEAEATRLALHCPAGRLRSSTTGGVAEDMALPPLAEVLVGPWRPAPATAGSESALTDRQGVRYDTPVPAGAVDSTPAAQLSLFGRARSHRAS